MPSRPEPKLSAQIPFDATVTAHDARDVPADALIEDRLPLELHPELNGKIGSNQPAESTLRGPAT